MQKTITGIPGDVWFSDKDITMPPGMYETILWFTNARPPDITGEWCGVLITYETMARISEHHEANEVLGIPHFKAMSLGDLKDTIYHIFVFENQDQAALFKLKWA